MIAKMVEIRDRGTFIPALAVKLQPGCERDRWLLARAGYGLTPEDQAAYVMLVRVVGGGGEAQSDPAEWTSARTLAVAHAHIIQHFDELEEGSVVDVEFILGEQPTPCRSEAEGG